jgi:hypothetical protein
MLCDTAELRSAATLRRYPRNAAPDQLTVFTRTLTGGRTLEKYVAAWAEAPAQAGEALVEELPWLHWLPESERRNCVSELLTELIAGAETGLLPFVHSLASWRSTAEAWADPQAARELQGPFAGDGPELPRPGGEAL